MSVRDRLSESLDAFPAALARIGIVDRERGQEAFNLAVPVMVTGVFRVLQQVADFAMVGLALGDSAIAGLEIGFQYYFIAFGLALALSSGTISVVSRYRGGDEPERANRAVEQSLWLAIVVAVPLTVGAWRYAEPLVGLLSDDPTVVRYGASYLAVVMLAALPRFWGLIAARALAGAGDTRTPMWVRSVTLPTNVILNAVLIFGVGPAPALGVVGAAAGTVIANVVAAATFIGILLHGRAGVRLPRRPTLELSLVGELVRVSVPEAGTRLSRTLARFPFLFVLGVLGPTALASYGIARRLILLAMMPAWGYATAASTLVGQSVGRGDEQAATAYGWSTTRIALATQLLVAALLAALAPLLARGFGTSAVAETAAFVRVFALGVAGFSVARTLRGALRGAGDTRWPLYGTLLGTYVIRLPVAALALPAGYTLGFDPWSLSVGLGLGLPAVFAAILGGLYVKAAVNTIRFASGGWLAVARASGIGVEPTGPGEN
ncbi:MATE family efflux transporter [Halosegnis sp.]|uniref:MATE family efflux transporter n=1 Tax=Halosegnis sp. TaxID=2864959 RepID=UPI0035D418D9